MPLPANATSDGMVAFAPLANSSVPWANSEIARLSRARIVVYIDLLAAKGGFADTTERNGSKGAIGRHSLTHFSISPSRNFHPVGANAPSLHQFEGYQ